MIGRDGTVQFRIDVRKVLDDIATTKEEATGGGLITGDIPNLLVVKLRFVHANTGAVIELRLPPSSETDHTLGGRVGGEIVFGANRGDGASNKKNDRCTRYLLDEIDNDDEEEESDDEPNEYVEDGFLVHGSHDSDEEEADSFQGGDRFSVDDEDDEDGECQICQNGGDLIVCDGGDHGGGCGHMYHVQCIGRRIIPPGKYHSTPCHDE
jgi:hypothetical protein